MTYVKDCHDTAMFHADKFLPLRPDSTQDVRYEKMVAALYEQEAACTTYLVKTDGNALDSVILFRSAATLALHADFPAMALLMVTTVLALDPPQPISRRKLLHDCRCLSKRQNSNVGT